jgi:flagellar hook assembly protein FlgD
MLLDRTTDVRLVLHDVSGRLVRTLVEGTRSAGVHRVEWDGRDDGGRRLAAGVYLARLEGAGEVRTRKVVLAR